MKRFFCFRRGVFGFFDVFSVSSTRCFGGLSSCSDIVGCGSNGCFFSGILNGIFGHVFLLFAIILAKIPLMNIKSWLTEAND